MWVLARNIGVPALISALLLAPMIVGVADADVYECKDSQGVVLFTDAPTRSGCRMIIGQKRQSDLRRSLFPSRFEELIVAAAERYGVDPDLVRAVIKAESDFNADARSRKGAQGLMQLMPETARLHNVGNVYDPGENIEGGVRHLKLLLDTYRGDLQLSLAAYNAGAQAVEKYGGIPPYSETKDYIRRVLAYHERYRGDSQTPVGEQAGQ